jgi:hypothetical protein
MWDWKWAEAESLRAIDLNPNYSEAYHLHSYIRMVTNHPAEAIASEKHGMKVDPFARPWALGYAYYRERQFDAAVNELRLREAADPKNAIIRRMSSEAYHFAGLEQEAANEWAHLYVLATDKDSAMAIRHAFEKGGYQAAADWELQHEKAVARAAYFSPFWRALESGRAGQREETLRLLEEAYRERSPRPVFLQNEPNFDFLHAEPRYQALVQKIGLPAIR